MRSVWVRFANDRYHVAVGDTYDEHGLISSHDTEAEAQGWADYLVERGIYMAGWVSG